MGNSKVKIVIVKQNKAKQLWLFFLTGENSSMYMDYKHD